MSFSAVIGNLRANLGLDTAQFDRGIKGAKSKLSGMQKDFGRFAGAAAAVGTALGALGVRTINSAKEISRLSQVANAAPEQFQRWAAASQTVGVEQEKLSDILKDVNDRVGDFLQTGGGEMADFFENIAPRVGVTAEQFAKLSGPEALQLYVDSLEKAGVNQQEMTYYLEAMASDLTLLQPLLRNGGEEMNRLADQAEGFGAIMDDKTIASLTRAKGALAQVQLVFKGFSNILGAAVAPIIERTANAFVSLSKEGAPLNNMIRAVAANLERFATYAATFAGFLAGRWVAAFAAARIATLSLSTALATLRGALIRTGVGALVVGAGELIYEFSRLVSATGGFGEALGLMKDVGVEAWDRVKLGAAGMVEGLKGLWADMESSFLRSLSEMATKAHDFFWKMAQRARGAGLDAMAEQFDSVVGMMDEASGTLMRASFDAEKRSGGFMKGAADLFGQATAPLESLQALRNSVKETGDEIDRTAGSAGGLGDALGGIDGVGGGSDGGGKEKLSAFAQAVKGTKEEVQRLKHEMESLVSAEASANGVADALTYARKRAELLSAAQQSGMEITPQLTARVNDLASAYSRAGHDAEDAADRLQAMEDQADRGADAISNMFGSMLDGSKSLKGALAGLLQQIAQFQISKAVTGLFGSDGPASGVGSLLGGLIGQNANGTNNWRGGWTTVGERGRELVNLPRGSQVVRNSETEKMLGAGGQSVMRVELGEGLVGQILQEAGNQSVQLVQASAKAQDRNFGKRLQQHRKEGR